MKHWRYLKYVLRHKWFVFVEGRKLGVPLYRLILHDWTKFLPREWIPYAEYFYGEKQAHEYFDFAWNHHQKRNDHHWQYWLLQNDDGRKIVLPMSSNARAEMIADWHGAGRALGKPDTRQWYKTNRHKMKLHPETRRFVDTMLGYLPEMPITEDAEDKTA